jgi:hypothetical protein
VVPPPPLLPPQAAMVRLKSMDKTIDALRLAFIMVQYSRFTQAEFSFLSNEV